MKSVMYSCSDTNAADIKSHLIYARLYCSKHNIKFIHKHYDNYIYKKFIKYNLFEDFIKSRYDRMLYIDWDVIISPKADNIFEVIPECRFGARYFHGFNILGEDDYNSDYNKFKSIFNIDKRFELKSYFNSGVILTDRETVAKICPVMINLAKSVTSRFNQNIKLNEKYIREEFLTNYVIQNQNINTTKLDERWNYSYKNEKLMNKEFVHFNCQEQHEKPKLIKEFLRTNKHYFRY